MVHISCTINVIGTININNIVAINFVSKPRMNITDGINCKNIADINMIFENHFGINGNTLVIFICTNSILYVHIIILLTPPK